MKIAPLAAAVLIFPLAMSSAEAEDGAAVQTPSSRMAEFEKRVMKPTAAQARRVAAGLKHGATLVESEGYAVKSQHHANAYYVVYALSGPGIDAFAAWCLSGDPDGSGLTVSADAMAATFSDWPKGSTTKAQASITDADCRDLLAFAKANKAKN